MYLEELGVMVLFYDKKDKIIEECFFSHFAWAKSNSECTCVKNIL